MICSHKHFLFYQMMLWKPTILSKIWNLQLLRLPTIINNYFMIKLELFFSQGETGRNFTVYHFGLTFDMLLIFQTTKVWSSLATPSLPPSCFTIVYTIYLWIWHWLVVVVIILTIRSLFTVVLVIHIIPWHCRNTFLKVWSMQLWDRNKAL